MNKAGPHRYPESKSQENTPEKQSRRQRISPRQTSQPILQHPSQQKQNIAPPVPTRSARVAVIVSHMNKSVSNAGKQDTTKEQHRAKESKRNPEEFTLKNQHLNPPLPHHPLSPSPSHHQKMKAAQQEEHGAVCLHW